MEILYLMVPLGLVLVGIGLWAFFWAVGSGQFDDLDSPGWSVLDDERKRKASSDGTERRLLEVRSTGPTQTMNALDAGSLSLGAALLAGLAGSGHCLSMCGGIAGALAMRNSTSERAGSRLALAIAYNVARVASYTLAGAVVGLLGRTLLRAVDVAPLSIAFRVLAGAIMVAAAGRLLFGWRLLDPLEAAGAGLWRRVLPGTRAYCAAAGPVRRDRAGPGVGLAALRPHLFDAAAGRHHGQRRQRRARDGCLRRRHVAGDGVGDGCLRARGKAAGQSRHAAQRSGLAAARVRRVDRRLGLVPPGCPSSTRWRHRSRHEFDG